jgi:hypothetical protein
MMAPAATVVWQLFQNFYEIITKAGHLLRGLVAAIARMFM